MFLQNDDLPWDIIKKALPYLFAVLTAAVSLWREIHLHKEDEIRRREGFGLSGWSIIGLAGLTCVLGIWAVVSDSYQHAIDSTHLKNADQALADQKEKIKTLNSDVKNLDHALDLKTQELIDEARASSKLIAGQAAVNARAIEDEQQLTFDSLLASASEPSQGVVEFALANPVASGHLPRERYFCEQFLTNWQLIQVFKPFEDLIDCSELLPIQFSVSFGVFRDNQNQPFSWGGTATTINKQKNPHDIKDLESARFLTQVGDLSRLIVRPSTFERPNLSDLWRGPTVDHPSAHIIVRLDGVDALSSNDRSKLADEAADLIHSVTIYYTVSARAALCKSMKLDAAKPIVGGNEIKFDFKGTQKIQNTICPEYMVRDVPEMLTPLS